MALVALGEGAQLRHFGRDVVAAAGDDAQVAAIAVDNRAVKWTRGALPVLTGRFPRVPFQTRRAPFAVHRAFHRC
jgi:hypothetical protein